MIKKLDEVVITICGFLLNPFITVVILLYRYAIYPNRFNNNFIITILSLFISLVNINKRIDEETDLLAYQTLFENAIGLSLNEYLFLIGKEPVFFTFQYYLAHFVNGNFLLAFFIYVFVIYFFALKSIAIFTGHLSIERQIMFPLGLVLFSFFPQTFSLAGHLLRQMIASSLMMYCLASHLVLNKKKYILALSACFIHSSLFLFLFFLLLKPYFEKKITFFQIGKIIFIACSCIIFINTAQNYLPFFIIYMIERVLNEEGTSFVVLTPIPVTGHVFMVFTLIESFLIAFFFNKKKTLWMFLFNISLFLFLFIIFNIKNTELSLRYYFYFYYLFPIFSSVVLSFVLPKEVLIFIISLLIINFIMFFDSTKLLLIFKMKYISSIQLITYTMFHYLKILF